MSPTEPLVFLCGYYSIAYFWSCGGHNSLKSLEKRKKTADSVSFGDA